MYTPTTCCTTKTTTKKSASFSVFMKLVRFSEWNAIFYYRALNSRCLKWRGSVFSLR